MQPAISRASSACVCEHKVSAHQEPSVSVHGDVLHAQRARRGDAHGAVELQLLQHQFAAHLLQVLRVSASNIKVVANIFSFENRLHGRAEREVVEKGWLANMQTAVLLSVDRLYTDSTYGQLIYIYDKIFVLV